MRESALVMSRSAVRVRSSALFFTCKTRKKEKSRCSCQGLCQQYVSSRLYPKASSMPSAACLPIEGIQCGSGSSSRISTRLSYALHLETQEVPREAATELVCCPLANSNALLLTASLRLGKWSWCKVVL